jgi:hypothetical protein
MTRLVRLLLAIALFIGGVVTGCQTDDWFDIDACYDRGGYWDRHKDTCIYS